MPDWNWDPHAAMKRYIQTLPGSRFWTPARVTGTALMTNPVMAPTATLMSAPVTSNRKLEHLPIPKAETPHDEASAARYGARWYREHASDAARDAAEQTKAENERLTAEKDLTKEEGRYRKSVESAEVGREGADATRKAMDEYREFLRKK